jgi:hypothetical protein
MPDRRVNRSDPCAARSYDLMILAAFARNRLALKSLSETQRIGFLSLQFAADAL